MATARLITIGTEITNGEVVNSNAAWISRKLEEKGVRVLSHLSVRDSKAEILQALRWSDSHSLIFVTGGLGPTSDDITRDCVAEFCGLKLEFDDDVWGQLEDLYKRRGLVLREAHRQQCYFPVGSERLANSVGTALGFSIRKGAQSIFVMPGPPRELEAMWNEEVVRRLQTLLPTTSERWVRWTCLGVPESEVAEVIEPIVKDQGFEVGYRAQVPYVKVKIHADPVKDFAILAQMEAALLPWIVARGEEDLAQELIKRWVGERLVISDSVCGAVLFQRLEEARILLGSKLKIEFHSHCDSSGQIEAIPEGEEAIITIRLPNGRQVTQRKSLPYRTQLSSERGKRSMAEWIIFYTVSALANP